MSQPLASFQISNSFQNLPDTVFHSIPKILVFLAILVIGWIVAKVLTRIVDVILRRIRFDHFVERGVVGQVLARSSTDATRLIARIVYYMLLLVTLQLAFGVWGPNPISAMLNAVVAWLPKAIVAIIIIVIASAIARVVKDLINAAIGGLSYGPFLASVASVIIALGAIAALNQVGIASTVTEPVLYTVLLTGGAVVAIGVGGGLIKPMQERWERTLSAAERETSIQIAAYQQGRTDAMRAPQHARQPQTAQQPGYASGQGYDQAPGYPEDPAPGYQPDAEAPDSSYRPDAEGPGYSEGPASDHRPGCEDSGLDYAEGPASGSRPGSNGWGDHQGTGPGDPNGHHE
jgi:hypothetical protein